MNWNFNLFFLFLSVGLNLISVSPSMAEVRSDLLNRNFAFKHLSQDQGLPGISLVDQIQDRNGIMWFSIESIGLARYDGHKFTLFQNQENDKRTLSSNYVNHIIEDPLGNLWLTTDYGVNYLNTRSNQITHYFNIPGDSCSLPSNICKAVAYDQHGQVWIGTENGLACKTNSGFRRFLSLPDTILNTDRMVSVQNIYIDKKGNFWLGTRGGLLKFNPDNGSVKKWSHTDQGNNKPRHDHVLVINEDNKGYLWIGTHRGLDRFNPEQERFESWNYSNLSDQKDLEQEGVNTICIDKKGIIWIGTYTKGIVMIDPEENDYLRINNDNKTLTSNHIRSIYEDKQDLIWIGTKFEGLFIFDDNTNLFSKWPSQYEAVLPLRNKYLLSFFEDRDQILWLGTKMEGLFRVDLKKDKIQQYAHRAEDPGSLLSNRVQSVIRDQGGGLWIGTEGGLNLLDEKTNVFSNFGTVPVNALFCDSKGTVWVGTTRGLFFVNHSINGLSRKPEDKNSFFFNNSNLDIIYIFQDSFNQLWFSTRLSGLFSYDLDTEVLINHSRELSGKNQFHSFMPRGISEDENGDLWIGSKDWGLFMYNRTDSSFTNYTMINGLPSNMVLNIEPCQGGDFWLGTYNGIARFNPRNNTSLNFNNNHGLLSQIIEIGVHHRFENGEILFGGNNGFNLFHPSDLNQEYVSLPLVITSIKAFDEELGRDITENQTLRLKSKQNYLSFEFTLPDYKNPIKHEYAVWMEGVDTDWKMLGNRNYATYTNLKPGNYNFHLRGANDMGIWSDYVLSLKIILQPPFYMTPWFKVLFALFLFLFALGVYFQIKNRQAELERLVRERTSKLEHAFDELFEKNIMINKQKAEIEAHHNLLELKVQERTRDLEEAKRKAVESDRLKSSFLANMSHEIRTPLNAITGFSTLICGDTSSPEKKEKYVGIIKSNANSLLKLVEDILDVSKIEAGQLTIHKDYFDVQNLMLELQDMFLQELKNKKKTEVELRLEIPDELPGALNLFSDQIRIKQVLINLLGNALKFTHTGKIVFSYRILKDRVTFSVLDTGIGIPVGDQEKIFNRFIKIEEENAVYRGTGLGLSISKSLVELLGGKIWVESEPGKGSCFSFEIPGPMKWTKKLLSKTRSLPKEADFTHLSILIIEDERSNYELLHSFFSGTGASVTWAPDGAIAVSFCEKSRYDLILLDIKMPGIDGYQTIKLLREIWPHVPVIAQTAFAQADDYIKVEQSGFNDILVKPFSREELYRIILKVVKKL